MKAVRNGIASLFVFAALVGLSGCGTLATGGAPESGIVASSADGSAIHYGVRGRGDVTLVFVHCWTCNHAFWDRQVEHFGRDYQVIWLDLAGHGASGSQRQHYTMRAFGQDVASVVDEVGAEKVILVGHSMGGPVAVEAAQLLGDRVLGVVGVDTFYTPFEYPKTDAEIGAMAKPFEQDFTATTRQMIDSMFTPAADPEVKRWVLAQFDGSKKQVGVSAMYDLLRWYADGRLGQCTGRLRNINGAPTGNEVPLHASVTLIPGAGHFVAQVKPVEFNAALQSMVEEFVSR